MTILLDISLRLQKNESFWKDWKNRDRWKGWEDKERILKFTEMDTSSSADSPRFEVRRHATDAHLDDVRVGWGTPRAHPDEVWSFIKMDIKVTARTHTGSGGN